MRALGFILFMFVQGISYAADKYEHLYHIAGWPEQHAHFMAALRTTQLRYQGSLPASLYQVLVTNSNQRFATQALTQRAIHRLRRDVSDPTSAIRFFESNTGKQVVQREIQATTPQALALYAKGLPTLRVSQTRRVLVQRLAAVLPISEAGAEVSVALTGVAADSLRQMLPGLGALTHTDGAIEQQRQHIASQLNRDLLNTLLFVYRDLTDAQLSEFAEFTESNAGRVYYQAALNALRAGLDVTP